MTDTINKPKMQLRSGLSFNEDKPPSPSAKLLINHGKPNFTIQRSPKVHQNGNSNPLSPQAHNTNNNYYAFKTANSTMKTTTVTVNSNGTNNNNNNNKEDKHDIVISSTKFNGAFRPANVAARQLSQDAPSDNEATKVVLRRTKAAEPPIKDGEDDNVPEFIRRQRRIQERLAKENVLDFENRRSGYFTHVMISPTSPNQRTSFVETMSSPAIVPALEIPPPVSDHKLTADAVVEEQEPEPELEPEHVEERYEAVVTTASGRMDEDATNNGHIGDEEVAKAIEEVNKAVAGEEFSDDTEVMAMTMTHAMLDEHQPIGTDSQLDTKIEAEQAIGALHESKQLTETPIEQAVVTSITLEHTEATSFMENGHSEVEGEHHNGHTTDDEVTILHTNAFDGPSIPAPDPSGVLGVNYEPKTVVSFSKDLSSEPNKYPDTVMVVRDGESAADDGLQEMVKLKFDIKADDDDVQVTSVLRAD